MMFYFCSSKMQRYKRGKPTCDYLFTMIMFIRVLRFKGCYTGMNRALLNKIVIDLNL